MPEKNHRDWPEELDRLQYTLNYVQKSLEETEAKESMLAEEVKRSSRAAKSDSSQEFIDMMINARIHESTKLKLRNLAGAQNKPYFARIDFKDADKDEVEKLYIGKMSLMRDEDKQMIIVDWRASISNLYYEERLGEAGYDCPQGRICGELSLKRQYSIESGELKDFFDIDITTTDEFLQQYLGANAENRLKDIVATIQVEQNRIIRAPLELPLIIQGVAGSGKTTIALHRIAYLIYNYQHTFKPENFMIIAPNRLFLNYISEVLPELGVEQVKQTTYIDWALELIDEKVKIRDPYYKLIAFVDHNASSAEEEYNRKVREISEFKSSLAFKKVLEEYAAWIERMLLPETDFGMDGWTVYTAEAIAQLYYHDYKHWPYYQRIEQLKKHFRKRLKDMKQEKLIKLQHTCQARIDQLKFKMAESESRQKQIIRMIDVKDAQVRRVEEFAKEGVKEYIKKIPKVSALKYYHQLFRETELYERFVAPRLQPELAAFLREETLKVFDAKSLDYEDLAPVIFLKHCCYGWGERLRVRHIVIDEAQDFSIFQYDTLHTIIKDSSFTILGDINQGIHAYRGIRNWRQLQQEVFGEDKSQVLTLEQSYRTTAEIMEAANQVLAHSRLTEVLFAKPVVRRGEPVEIAAVDGYPGMIAAIDTAIVDLQQRYRSIAVITKTSASAQNVYQELKDQKYRPMLINGTEDEYHGGIVILPSYLAKGLEFDAVIIADGSEANYRQDNELDIKLLYVAMTRPLHRLIIYYYGELSGLLKEVGGTRRELTVDS